MAVANPQRREYGYVQEIEDMVKRRFPDARFRVTQMPDDEDGVAIWTYSSAGSDDLRELVQARELELLDDDVYIVTVAMPLESWED